MSLRHLPSRRVVMTGVAWVATLAAVCVTGAPMSSATPSSAAPAVAPFAGPGTDQLIVKMTDGSTPDIATLARAVGEPVTLRRRLAHGSWVGKLGVERSSAQMRVLAAKIAALPGVAYAEPDQRLFPTLIPTDPRWGEQWDMAATNFGANAPAAWDVTRGTSDVIVAVVDTGITNHADLVGQTVPGYDFISDINVANDGTLRDADPSDPGDWITAADAATATFAGCPVGNSSWHGTHVSGTIAAKSDNGIGIAGIASNVKIEPIRVLGKCGGFTSDIVDGMRWAAGLSVAGVPANPNPASVISMSLGGAGVCSQTEQLAITDIVAVGVTVVVAAGNNSAQASGFTPGSCNGVITVAATGSTGNRASYSNFGTIVELAAQGGDVTLAAGTVLSTVNAGATTPTTDTYAGYEGTSMATPHVSGAVALLKSLDPSLTPAQILTVLQTSARAFPAGSTCTTTTCGAGILDIGKAVATVAATAPARTLGAFAKTAPVSGTTGLGATTTLTWSPSTGATSYDYCLVAGVSTACTWVTVGNVTSVAVSGLVAGTVYAWQVRATSGTTIELANDGTRATFTSGTAVGPLPAAFAKTAPANASTLTSTTTATLAWAASTGATSFAVCVDTVVNNLCDGTWTNVGTLRTSSLTALPPGTTHEWQVQAINAAGTTLANAGVAWTFKTAALVLPGAFAKTAPANAAALTTTTTAALTWGASTGATSYAVCVDTVVNNVCDGTWTSTGTALTSSLTALPPATTHEWQVRATNAAGTTLANAGVAWTFKTAALALPGAFAKTAPANGATLTTTTSAALSWGASTGATSYEYCVDTVNNNLCDGTWTSTGTLRTATKSGLTTKTIYYWQVRARNAAGTTDANVAATGSTWWRFTTK